MRRHLFPLFFIVGFPLKLAFGSSSFIDEALAAYAENLSFLRLNETDIQLPPGWEIPLTTPVIEDFFKKPLHVPKQASSWADQVESSTDTASLFKCVSGILLEPATVSLSNDGVKPPSFSKKIGPEPLKAVLKQLYIAVSHAQRHVNAAVDSVSQKARKDFLTLFEELGDPSDERKEDRIASRRTKEKYNGMTDYKMEEMLAGTSLLLETVDRVLPPLQQLALSDQAAQILTPIRWKTPLGVFLVGGSRSDTYQQEDLNGVTVLIELGGKNKYEGLVAAAQTKQIRLVIDLGTDIRVTGSSTTTGGAGSGVYGIGVMVLPNPVGNKVIESESFSQGCGVAGVGALFINGRTHLKAGRYSQGFGALGVGLLHVQEASDSSYYLSRNGQGLGMVRGVGLFSHRGDNTDIVGGLEQPDPREPLGAISLCQGVGFGQRAFSGGGTGLAIFVGNKISVKASYFAQGAGYWHSLGAIRIKGHDNVVQARRYHQGTGVHFAFGHFELIGQRNRILSWGGGPAHGWDRSFGSLVLMGDQNEMQSEWGHGYGAIGGLSFSYIKGNGNRLSLPQWGTSYFFRNEQSYALQIIRGHDNVMKSPIDANENGVPVRLARDPWSLCRFEGVRFVSQLDLAPPDWTALPQEETRTQEEINLQNLLAEAQTKTPLEEVAGLADVASAFSLDKETPRQALEKLITLPVEKIPYLIEVLDPAAVDQMIQLAVAIPAHGEKATAAVIKYWGAYPPRKKAALLHFLGNHRPSLVAPVLFDEMKNMANSKTQGAIRSTAIRTLGQLFNRDIGQEPGLRAVREILYSYLKNPGEEARKKTAVLLESVRLGEAFGLLAALVSLTDGEKQEFLKSGPIDVTDRIAAKGAETFLKLINNKKAQAKMHLEEDLNALRQTEKPFRSLLFETLKSTEASQVQAAAVALGQIAHPEDAAHFLPLFGHSKATVREAASVALGRLGKPSLSCLKEALHEEDPRARRLAINAVAHAVSPSLWRLVIQGFGDKDETVRLSALTVINHLPTALQKHRPKLVRLAKTRLRRETDPDVKLARDLLK